MPENPKAGVIGSAICGFKCPGSPKVKADQRLPAQSVLSIEQQFWVCQTENDTFFGGIKAGGSLPSKRGV